MATREGAAKRSQGHVQAGILSREMVYFRVPTLLVERKATSPAALSRAEGGPCAVEDPVHVRNLHAREPGGLVLARRSDHQAGRSGKAKAAILR